MKIVNILGGIGNQMFQYAFAVALREETGVDVRYDASVFKTYPLHNGFELDRRFCVSIRQASSAEVWKLTIHTTRYFLWKVLTRIHIGKTKHERKYTEYLPDVFDDKKDLYYYGYWQHHAYFDKYKDVLKREFSWKEPLSKKNQEVYNSFCEKQTVSIHVRRGDYLKKWIYRDICELDYYRKAIACVKEMMPDDVQFAIFSNDMTWCNDNIVPLLDDAQYVMVDWNQGAESHNDMRLMQACRANIIANSSFSWWAAYLNVNDNPIVIAPKVWTNEDVNFKLQLDEWVLI